MNKLGFNFKRSWAISLLNLRALRTAFWFCLIPAGAMLIQFIVSLALTETECVSIGAAFLTFLIFIPILLTSTNFNKTMRLNAKKIDYFWSAIIIIAILSATVALINLVFFYAMDDIINKNLAPIKSYSLYEVFGFASVFPLIGFLQMFGLCFFFGIFVLVLSSIQDKWFGWVLDLILAAVLNLIIFVPVLNEHVLSTLAYVLVTGHPLVQIAFTFIVGFALYLLYLIPLRRKKI